MKYMGVWEGKVTKKTKWYNKWVPLIDHTNNKITIGKNEDNFAGMRILIAYHCFVLSKIENEFKTNINNKMILFYKDTGLHIECDEKIIAHFNFKNYEFVQQFNHLQIMDMFM
ncbi:hypothetical protein RFI_31815 [Reticulomyxa filosa]|uniref:Uncharacterized protein n=1 Tax=Reticulomyxa filosa TaxID=46433 RepID=X6LW29_RETFI|nr:hypothetical protein RFI_31815 [Reticulomyxa filosa]|eukprot:ETO05581.1 hypothetical protein RFI_31815 [Reticulomyxa filosa]